MSRLQKPNNSSAHTEGKFMCLGMLRYIQTIFDLNCATSNSFVNIYIYIYIYNANNCKALHFLEYKWFLFVFIFKIF